MEHICHFLWILFYFFFKVFELNIFNILCLQKWNILHSRNSCLGIMPSATLSVCALISPAWIIQMVIKLLIWSETEVIGYEWINVWHTFIKTGVECFRESHPMLEMSKDWIKWLIWSMDRTSQSFRLETFGGGRVKGLAWLKDACWAYSCRISLNTFIVWPMR